VVEEAVSWIKNLSHSYNATIDKSYTQNEIEITADVKNPNNHSLSIVADILKNDMVIDSLNCTIAGNKISGTWTVPVNSEDFYSVTIRTKDNEDSTVHTLPNITRFTTAGPVTLDSISYRKGLLNYHSVRPFVHNWGTVKTITNASLRITCNNPWIASIGQGSAAMPNIAPNSSVGLSSWITIGTVDSIFPGYFNLKVEVMSNGWPFWVDSTKVITGVNQEIVIPSAFNLEQNYPNPFNPTTTIGFGIMEKGNVRLSVLNILGEEIKVLLNEEKEAGYHSIEFDASDLPSGVYFYQLKAGEFVQTKKMILLR